MNATISLIRRRCPLTIDVTEIGNTTPIVQCVKQDRHAGKHYAWVLDGHEIEWENESF